MTEEECEAYAAVGSSVVGVITFIPMIGWVIKGIAGIVSIVIVVSGVIRCERYPSEDLASYLATAAG